MRYTTRGFRSEHRLTYEARVHLHKRINVETWMENVAITERRTKETGCTSDTINV